MKNLISRFLLVLAVLLLALAPVDGFARAGSTSGGSMSMGSRGSRTYQSVPSAPTASPIQRSVTPPPSYQTNPSYAPSAPVAPAYPQSGWHPFWSGLAGGFLGGSLAHMLFGSSMGYGYGGMGFSPMGSMLGGLFQLLLMFGIGYWIYKVFFRNGPRAGRTYTSEPMFQTQPQMQTQSTASIGAPFAPTGDDISAFRDLLVNIQVAWGKADLTHLRQYVTPEILQYFNEALSNNSSRGLANIIRDVVVVSCDVLEAWTEYDLDYVTARMKWSAVDFMARLDREPAAADYVASGDSQRAEGAEEIWTFARAHGGGHWLLSAIQQVG
ncbi:MAG: TIM44-like domain-containing protein [Alphaproteobacteria bacterium]|nr:TIM44-like domain-containing protein [Alphaproteobacteria bacterium]MBV8548894.1 TIM44-like domain-containing protein [Alphaproteobacteria bacterium]